MKIDYPYLRKLVPSGSSRIEVMADSLRVGKTTAVEVIAEGLRKSGKRITVSYEDWQNNPYLKESYSDPAKAFLESQKWFIRRKWEQVSGRIAAGICVQDVSPEMDFCYATTNMKLGRMSLTAFEEYSQYYHALDWSLAPAPRLLVYLSVSDDVLLQRAMDSRREFETVEPEYFLMMKRVNRGWLEGVTDDYKVLVVDTDKLDFAHDPKAQNRLVAMVAAQLELS